MKQSESSVKTLLIPS